MSFDLTIFDEALQDKLDTASVSLNAQEYLLLTKAVQSAIEISEGVSLLELKNTPNGIAGLNASGYVDISQLLNVVPSQGGNSGKYLTTDGNSTSWATVDALPLQSGNENKVLTTNGTNASWTNSPSLVSLTTSEDIVIGENLYVGDGAQAFESSAELTDALAVFKISGGEGSFAQIAFTNAEPTSSTDIIAYMDNGNDTNGWISLGITGSEFDDELFGITGPGDAYIFHDTLDDTYAGNLVFATGASGSENKIIFAAGGFDSGLTQMEITPDVNVHIEIDTPSISPTTGALTVVGGVGIQGDMNIQGNVAIQGTITFGGEGTTVETENLTVTDPLIFVGNGNTADTVDLGLIGEYTLGEVTKYTGIVRDASDGKIKAFVDATTKPTSSVNFSEEGLSLAAFQVGAFEASSATIGNVSNTELQYLDGVTSAIQTQLNAKAPSASPTFSGTITTPLTTAGYVTTTSDGIIGSVATIPNNGLTNSSITINGATVSLGGNVTITGESFHPFLLMGA